MAPMAVVAWWQPADPTRPGSQEKLMGASPEGLQSHGWYPSASADAIMRAGWRPCFSFVDPA